MIANFTRKDFLEAIFSEYYKEHRGFILVKSFRRGDPKISTRYFPNIEILAKENYGEERDVYFGICPRERMKPDKEHIHYLVALWADLDIGVEGHEGKKFFFEGPQQAAKAIRGFPRAPSIIVESGRGAHLYWLLKQVEPVSDPEKVEKLLREISDYLKCDTEVNLDTVLRVPETLNTKVPGKSVGCEVKFINANFRYTLSDFEKLGERLVAVPAGLGPASAHRAASAVGRPGGAAGTRTGPGSFGGATPAIDDSLVLDETIIDELIDDISMTSIVLDPISPAGVEKGQTRMPPSTTEWDIVPGAPTTSVVVDRAPGSMVPVTSSVLERLSSSRTVVEISLVGSGNVIKGVLAWSEKGLLGVESGEDLYTIPISSVSYIRSKVT